MSLPRPRARRLVLALAFLVGGAPSARAEETTVAAAEALLERGEAEAAVAAFLALAARPGGDEDLRVQAGLGAARMATENPHGAIEPLGIVVRRRGEATDRLALARALLEAARANMASGPRISADVVPYLQDALAQVAAATEADAATAARLAFVLGQTKWLLGDAAAAYDAFGHPGLAEDPEALDGRARAAYSLGRFPEAAAAWTAAGNTRGAAAAWAAAKDERALDLYLALCRASPSDLPLLDEAAMTATYLGRADAWDATLAQVEVPEADRAVWLRGRARVYERAGRLDLAAARYREAIAAAPGDLDARTDLARVLVNLRDDERATLEAAELYLAVLAGRPEDPWARQGLDYLATREAAFVARDWPDRTRLDRCIAWFRALTKADPESPLPWSQLGTVLRMAGESEEAVAAFDRALVLNPYDGILVNDRGLTLLGAGDLAGARAAFEAAAALDPNDTSPRQNAGRLAWVEGDLDAATAWWAAALEATRTVGGKPMLFRFLLDRAWRARVAASR